MKIAPLAMAAALAIGLLGGCASGAGGEDESAAGTPIVPAETPAVRDVDPALWEISDADTRIYLFGTVHMLPPRLGWFDEAVRDAYDASDAVIMELVFPPEEEMVALLLDIGIARDGIGLRDRLAPETRTQYEALMQRLGQPVALFDAYKPWAAYIALYQLILADSGFDPAAGIEPALTAAAARDGKPVIGLETAEEQYRIFDGLSDEEELALLSELVAAPDAVDEQLEQVVRYWSKGDVKQLGEYLASTSDGGETDEALIGTRNSNWVAQIESRLDQPGTFFLAVGTAHLAGPDNVRDLLARQGIAVKRIKY